MMLIKGLQKLTLNDYPNAMACTLFLYGCNFRCKFCHNPELVKSPTKKTYSEKKVLAFLEERKHFLDGVCITGGEPLLTLEKSFVAKIKDMGYLVKIDTNGTNPEKLEEFINEGLIDFVAMDIKTCPDKYDKIVSVHTDIQAIEKSIVLITSRLQNYEFRTTIVDSLHTTKDISRMSKWVKTLCDHKPKRFCLQGFKIAHNLMDDSFKAESNVTEMRLEELKSVVESDFEEVLIRA